MAWPSCGETIMNKKVWMASLVLGLACLAYGGYAWLDRGLGVIPVEAAVQRKFMQENGNSLAERTLQSVAEQREYSRFQQDPAIQVGRVNGTVVRKEEDGRWYGTVRIWVKAEYHATYGLPYNLIEKGFRVIQCHATTSLVVIVDAPVPLSVGVDTGSMHVSGRNRSGLRTWKTTSRLEARGQKRLSGLAEADARKKCQDRSALEATRAVVKDLVLDMAGDLYSRRMKRFLAPRTTVWFAHELNSDDFKKATTPALLTQSGPMP